MAYISPQALSALQLSDGDLIEIVRDDAPTIRAWIKSDAKIAANIIRVATDAARILRSQTGDAVRVRSVGRPPAAV